MSTKSKYPSRRVLVPAALIAAQAVTGLPPMYIVASGIDPIKDESIKLAMRLQEEGQEYYLSMWPGVGHSAASFIFTPVIPELQSYYDSMTVYLRGMLTDNIEAEAEPNNND